MPRDSLRGSFSPARVYRLLTERGWSLTDLEARSGLCSPVVFWLDGRQVPTTAIVTYLACLIGVKPGELMDPHGDDEVAAEDAAVRAWAATLPPMTPVQQALVRRTFAAPASKAAA